jgi:hypothetical protein
VFEGGDRFGLLPPPHEVRDLIGFLQTVHAAPQPVLVAMLARTEVYFQVSVNPLLENC